jgi:hypothetical protein
MAPTMETLLDVILLGALIACLVFWVMLLRI